MPADGVSPALGFRALWPGAADGGLPGASVLTLAFFARSRHRVQREWQVRLLLATLSSYLASIMHTNPKARVILELICGFVYSNDAYYL